MQDCDTAPGVEGKDGNNPKGKGRGRKGKGKGRGRGKKAGEDKQDQEEVPTETVVGNEIPEIPKEVPPPKAAVVQEKNPPKRGRADKADKGRADKADKADQIEPSAGSEVQKRKKKGKTAQTHDEVEVEAKPKDEKAKKRKEKEVEPKDDKDKDRKKRVRHSEAQTFARRAEPLSSFGKAKWVALRAAFVAKVKPLLEFYSAHEDCCSKNVLHFLKL